jgi:hypothetical protein
MSSIPQVCAALQQVLSTVAERAARATGFVKRTSKLSGAGFVQTLVFGFLANPRATRADLATSAAALDCVLSPQAIDQRMTDAAAECLDVVVAAATRTLLAAEAVAIPLLQRFTGGVWLQDTTTIGLPRTLAHLWVGGSNQHRAHAALKLGVRLNLSHGSLQGPFFDHASTNDRRTAIVDQALPPDSLRIADLGFFDLTELALIAAGASFWLSRLQILTAVFLPDGQRLDLVRWLEQQPARLDQQVLLGVEARLPARLLAVRVPQEVVDQRRRRLYADAARRGRKPSALQLALVGWTLYVTNVPADRLQVEEALVLGRARWQIELLFKRWKSQGQLSTWRSGKPSAIRCELYAKLLALLVSQWMLLVSCWAFPDRSLAKALTIIQQHARCLATAFHSPELLASTISTLGRCLGVGCRISKQQAHPPTFQLLLDVAEASLA